MSYELYFVYMCVNFDFRAYRIPGVQLILNIRASKAPRGDPIRRKQSETLTY